MGNQSEFTVKGAWFVVARDFVLLQRDQAAVDAVGRYVTAEHRDTWLDPMTSAWYPEQALQEAFVGLHQVVADGSAAAFEEICAECTRRALSRFFTAVLSLSTPSLVLKSVPTMWRAIRRGPATVEVRQVEGGSEIHYGAFPFFGDLLYRRMTVGSLTALIEGCRGGGIKRVSVADWSSDHLVALVRHGDEGSVPPPPRL